MCHIEGDSLKSQAAGDDSRLPDGPFIKMDLSSAPMSSDARQVMVRRRGDLAALPS